MDERFDDRPVDVENVRGGIAWAEHEQSLRRAVSEERRRLAFELHDGLGQILAAIGMNAEIVEQMLNRGCGVDPVYAQKIAALVQDGFAFTRRLGGNSASLSVRGDLFATLRGLANTVREMFGIDCHVLGGKVDTLAESARSHQLFRIAQESINNAIKHGAATQVILELSRAPDLLRLRIKDNGKGFRGAPRRTGIGIQIMQRRAASIGARVEITSREHRGTVVECRAPVSPDD
jgi:signal transduction histidine kinase